MKNNSRALRAALNPIRYAASLDGTFLGVEVTAGRRRLDLADGMARALALMRRCAARGGTIVFIGNGGSAAIAGHMAVDYWKNGRLRATAFNDAALLTCLSNDFGYPRVFEAPIAMFARRGDVLVAISSSGRSENILRGAAAARRRGCRVVTLSGFRPDNPLRGRGDLNFYAPANAYGPVEITHLALLHGMLDAHIATR